jgi:hypothetical protein
LLAFSDSEHTSEDSDLCIDDDQEVVGFEMKKRKLDEAGGRPHRRASSRQTGKIVVGGGSSAVASKPLKTKIAAARGVNPSKKGKGVNLGPTDVER